MKKIIAGFSIIAILFPCFILPTSAAVSPGTWLEGLGIVAGIGSFLLDSFSAWQAANPDSPPSEYDGFGHGGGFESSFMASWRSDTATCPSSEAPGGYHYIDPDVPSHSAGFGSEGTNWEFCCLYCHEYFTVTGDSLSEAYKDYVSTFPATGITSSGSIIWDTFYSFTGVGSYGYHYEKFNNPQVGYTFSDSLPFVAVGEDDSSTSYSFDSTHKAIVGTSSSQFFACGFSLSLSCPVSGSYRRLVSPSASSKVLCKDGQTIEKSFSFSIDSLFVHYYAGDAITVSNGYGSLSLCDARTGVCSYGSCSLFFPRYEIIPDSAVDSSGVYSIDFRPTSITGNYGIIGDNGQIINVDSTTIINETNNTYTNPSTGTTSTITEWTYDYSDRSYNVTLESGDTITVTYGDEYITILEGDTTYNVYYIVEGSGDSGENPGTDPCKHDYTSTTDREATCTVPGQMTYTCSLCGDSYKESIPAKGHTWTVLQTVTTEYDQEGNLLQQGYTIYQCSVCGEQYKDEAGTGPPSSGGDEDDGESIWDKLGNLLGSVFDGMIGMVEAVIGKILDALIALVEMISEKLTAVVTLILGFFDEIPQLFSGFLAFLTAAFPFLPEDIMLLLTFGIAVVVLIGIIKALRR